MEEYAKMISNFSFIGPSLGLLIAVYTILFLGCDNTNDVKSECNRVVDTLNSVIHNEVDILKSYYNTNVTNVSFIMNENPYDLFTRIYPTLKEMDNDRIDEFIQLLNNYNNKWISEKN